MRCARLLPLIVVSIVMAAATLAAAAPAAPAAPHAGCIAPSQEAGPGRGDDLARIQKWRAFLDPAVRAFTAAKMSTTAVKAKIAEADERLAELRDDPESKKAGRSDITGDISFLERAQRAFTAAHLSTTEVNKWLEEAKEGAASD